MMISDDGLLARVANTGLSDAEAEAMIEAVVVAASEEIRQRARTARETEKHLKGLRDNK